MASLFLHGTKVCDVSSVSIIPGQRKMERVGEGIVPGRKDPDSVTFTCTEPILLEPMYELHLDDGKILSIIVSNTTGTQGGSLVKALIQP